MPSPRTIKPQTTEAFERDVAQHQLQVIRDEGLSRHLRFRRPGTMTMHFDLITWPGHLCYTGDMGTFVFRRLTDMFEFFRRDEEDAQYRIDLRYWAEKVESADRADGLSHFSPEALRAEVRDHFEQHTADEEDWPQARRDSLWAAIERDVLSAVRDDASDEHRAWAALGDFRHEDRDPLDRRSVFRFDDFERDCREWSHRFVWCCHALRWAIARYDAHQASLIKRPGVGEP